MKSRARFGGLAIAGLLTAWAGVACADPAFDAFRALCLDTGADFPAVTAAADRGGWKSVEAPVSLIGGVTASDKMTRGKQIGGVDANLAAWRGKTTSNVAVSDCEVQLGRGDFSSAVANVQGWTGFTPQDNKEQKAVFRFTDAGGVRKAVAPSEYDGAAAASGMDILTVVGGPGGVEFDLLKIKK